MADVPVHNDERAAATDGAGGPSRTLASQRAELLRFRARPRDDAGKKLPSVGELTGGTASWSLLSPPWAYGTESTGISIYMVTIAFFALLMLLFSLIGLLPLAQNLGAQNYANTFRLLYTGPQAGGPGEVFIKDCPHTKKGMPSLANKMTVGSFCPNSAYSNAFDCPSKCLFDTRKLDRPECQSIQNELWFTTDEDAVCNARMPCYPWEADGNDERADSSQCFCCDLQLDEEGTLAIPAAQFWLWGVVAVLVYMLWVLGLQLAHQRVANSLNASVTTAADFAVTVTGKGVAKATTEELAEFASHYGEVVQAVKAASIGEVLQLGTQIAQKELLLEELEGMQAGPAACRARRRGIAGACLGAFDWLYRRYVCLHQSPRGAAASTTAAIDKLKLDLAAAEQAVPHVTDTALIVFNYEAHARNMLKDHYRVRHVLRHVNTLLGGALSRGPKVATQSAAGATEYGAVVVRRAAEPSDVLWDSMRRPRVVLWTRLVVWAATVAAIAVSAGLQFYIARLDEESRRMRTYCERGQGEPDTCRGTSLTIDDGLDTALRSAWAWGRSLVVIAANSLASVLIAALSYYELHPTYSNMIEALTFKLSLFYVINSFAVPLLAVLATEDSDRLWYISGGVAQSGLQIQLLNAIIPNVLALLYVPDSFNHLFFSRFARTQAMADALLEPPLFDLAIRFANAFKTLTLAVLYAPILPISPAIGLLAMILSYVTDQFLILRVARRPPAFELHAFNVLVDSLRVLPLLMLLLMHLVYFAEAKFWGENARSMTGPFWVGMAIWVLFQVVPAQGLLGLTRNKYSKDSGTGGASFLSIYARALEETDAAKPTPETASVRALSELGVAVKVDAFVPYVPDACSDAWARNVAHLYRAHMPPLPANQQLLAGQREDTGGDATRPSDNGEGAAKTVQLMRLVPASKRGANPYQRPAPNVAQLAFQTLPLL